MPWCWHSTILPNEIIEAWIARIINVTKQRIKKMDLLRWIEFACTFCLKRILNGVKFDCGLSQQIQLHSIFAEHQMTRHKDSLLFLFCAAARNNKKKNKLQWRRMCRLQDILYSTWCKSIITIIWQDTTHVVDFNGFDRQFFFFQLSLDIHCSQSVAGCVKCRQFQVIRMRFILCSNCIEMSHAVFIVSTAQHR